MAGKKQDEFLITGKQPVIKLMERIIASKRPVTVAFNKSHESFSSFLFAVSADHNACLIDSLVPSSGNQRLIAGESASVQCKIDGITSWFGAGKITKTGKTNDQGWLQMTLPTRAWYQQRRNAFRAQAIGSLNLTVALFSQQRQRALEARIDDLSVTGCRLSIPRQPTPPVINGEEFYRCQILRSGRQVVSCGATARHVEPGHSGANSHLGLSFTNLTPQQDSVLSQLVIKLELAMNQERLQA